MPQLYVVVLAIIAAVLLAVAIYRTTRVKTKADYLVAGRSLPAIVLVLTLLNSFGREAVIAKELEVLRGKRGMQS